MSSCEILSFGPKHDDKSPRTWWFISLLIKGSEPNKLRNRVTAVTWPTSPHQLGTSKPLLTYRSKIWRFPKSWGYPKWMVYKGKSIYKWMIHMKNHPELAKIMFGLWFFSTLPKKSWSTGLTSAIHWLSHKCTGPIFFAPVRFSVHWRVNWPMINENHHCTYG